MRELVLKMTMSLDGFVCGPDGEMDWMFATDGQGSRQWTMETLNETGLHIMGSRTFMDMKSWWPTSTDPFAAPMNEIPKAVFTRNGLADAKPTVSLESARRTGSATQGARQPHAETWDRAEVIAGDMAEGIKRLKQQDGKLIVAHGGAGFARSLIRTGLIDEYRLAIFPVAIGNGQPIFSKVEKPLNLKLQYAKAFDNGVVAHVYRPAS